MKGASSKGRPPCISERIVHTFAAINDKRMDGFILAINSKGEQRTFSERTWHLMRSMKEQGKTRKGWTEVKTLTEGEARDFERGLGKKSMTPARPATGLPATPKATFIPKEIEEHAKKVADEAAAGAGEKVTPEEVSEEIPPSATEQAPPPPAQEQPANQPAGEAQGQGAAAEPDDLSTLPNIANKSVKALNDAGITTFRALLDAGPAKIEDILNKAGLAAKTPVIPRWMAAAAEKVAQA